MGIKQWPASQRPRDKLIKQGAQALSDAELLAIFLRTGTQGVDAVELARRVVVHFGSLQALINASKAEFCACLGLGEAKFAQLQAVVEMSKRYLGETLEKEDVFTCVDSVQHFLKAKLRLSSREVFAVMFLDSQHRLIHFQEMFYGTIDAAAVYPREVVKMALSYNAAACILAHNHPSGVSEPSQADIYITQKLQQALSLVDINLLDHFVIGDGKPISLAERGHV